MARHAAPSSGEDWREDVLRSAEGRARRLRPLLTLPWTPASSATAAEWLRASAVISYQESQIMDSPSVSLACRVFGLPPIAVEMREMEATPGGFPPGSRGHDTYFKLPPDSTDMSFGQLGDDYMDGELPAALTAEERSARALKLQSLMACFSTTVHLLREKKESLGALCKLWAEVQCPAGGGAAAAEAAEAAAAAPVAAPPPPAAAAGGGGGASSSSASAT